MIIANVGKVEIDMQTEKIHISLYKVDMEGADMDYFKHIVLTHVKQIIQKEMDKYEGIKL